MRSSALLESLRAGFMGAIVAPSWLISKFFLVTLWIVQSNTKGAIVRESLDRPPLYEVLRMS